MIFTDAAPVSGTRRTKDGYLVADVRIARAGNIQVYGGQELGKPDMAIVRVWRPHDAVFDGPAMASFAYRPVTVNHPAKLVDSTNWRDHAVGFTGGEIARDGEFIRVPLLLTDADAIRSVESGTREVSCGYACDIAWEPGTTPSGDAYDAKITRVVGNHLAIVPKGRAGSECRIGDESAVSVQLDADTMASLIARAAQNQASTNTGGRPVPDEMKTVVVDGLTISVPHQGMEAIQKLQRQIGDAQGVVAAAEKRLNDAVSAHAAAIQAKDGEIAALQAARSSDVQAKDGEIAALQAAHTAALQAKDGEIAALQAQVSDEALEARAAARAGLISQAKTVLGDSYDPSGKSDADMRRDVVMAAIGKTIADAATRPPVFFDHAFEVVMANHKTAPQPTVDPLRVAIASGAGTTPVGDSAKPGWQRRAERTANAWMNNQKGNA